MRRRGRRHAIVGIVLGLFAFAFTGWIGAAAGVVAPFFDQPEALRHAFETESLAVRLTAAAAVAGDNAADEAAQMVADARATYLPLFSTSLQARDPDLARRLSISLDQAEAAAARGDGDALADSLAKAQARVREAQDRLVSQSLLDAPGFAAALAFTLLLWEGGVAEGFEEAVEEGEWDEYLIGRAALQHVDALWQGALRPTASTEETREIEDMLDRLKALFAVQEPSRVLAHDPEEGETWAQYLVGSLERLTGAELYPDRDPGRLIAFFQTYSQQACTSLEAAESGPGRENLRWAGMVYDEHLSAVAGLFLPTASQSVEEALEALAEGGSVEGERGCTALLAGLAEIASVFGG